MYCCIFAAFILAQCALMLRRWGRFWGVLPREQAGDLTALDVVRCWVRKPLVRLLMVALLFAEAAGLGYWAAASHGDHLLGLGRQALVAVLGEPTSVALGIGEIVYIPLCAADGTTTEVPVFIN